MNAKFSLFSRNVSASEVSKASGSLLVLLALLLAVLGPHAVVSAAGPITEPFEAAAAASSARYNDPAEYYAARSRAAAVASFSPAAILEAIPQAGIAKAITERFEDAAAASSARYNDPAEYYAARNRAAAVASFSPAAILEAVPQPGIAKAITERFEAAAAASSARYNDPAEYYAARNRAAAVASFSPAAILEAIPQPGIAKAITERFEAAAAASSARYNDPAEYYAARNRAAAVLSFSPAAILEAVPQPEVVESFVAAARRYAADYEASTAGCADLATNPELSAVRGYQAQQAAGEEIPALLCFAGR
jgi:hypothetical protein